MPTRAESVFAELSDQELCVLGIVAEGYINHEIAERLFLGDGTVANYVSDLLNKLGLSNRAKAAALATKHNVKAWLSGFDD